MDLRVEFELQADGKWSVVDCYTGWYEMCIRDSMGLNTVLVPAYWDLTETMEGKFDFTLTEMCIRDSEELYFTD